MILKPNLLNVVSIGLMAFAGVWVINRVLVKSGLTHLTSNAAAE
jgi:hypothetical protein